jgi:hypothetical protein
MGEWSADEREALRTLAAAEPAVRAQAISDVVSGSPVSEPRAGSPVDSGGGPPVTGDPQSAPPPAAREQAAGSQATNAEPRPAADADGANRGRSSVE